MGIQISDDPPRNPVASEKRGLSRAYPPFFPFVTPETMFLSYH
jgi:hypothetical protein